MFIKTGHGRWIPNPWVLGLKPPGSSKVNSFICLLRSIKKYQELLVSS